MIFKPTLLCASLVLLCPSLALAQSGPTEQLFTGGLSQTFTYQSNLLRAVDGAEDADLQSTTSVWASLSQPVGRHWLIGKGELGLDRYRDNSRLNSTRYMLDGQWLWSTAERLEGTVAVRATQRRYEYGGVDGGDVPFDALALEKTESLSASAALGVGAAWTWQTSLQALRRHYSETALETQDLRQASLSTGLRYSANPDLELSADLRYTNGSLPHFDAVLGADDFTQQGLDAGVRWQLSGASQIDARLGYARESHDLQGDRSFWNGRVRATWRPSDLLSLGATLSRDNAGSRDLTGSTQALSFTTQSINTTVGVDARWQLTGKIAVSAGLQQARRRFDGAVLGQNVATGTDQQQSARLGLSYAISRGIDLSCELSHLVGSADSSLPGTLARDFSANTVRCGLQLALR